MADSTNTPPVIPDPAKHNAEIAAKLAAQDINGKSTVTGDFSDASGALDALAAQVKPKEPAAPAASTPPAAPAAPVVIPPASPPADDPAVKRAAEFFKDSPALPPGAAPKSSEAFAAIKLQAAKDIVEKEKKIEELTKQIEKSKQPSPEILEKDRELEDLRAWRAKLDVEFDPKFKQFDTQAEQHREFIYAQLRKNPGITEATINEIKKYGGPDMVNMSKVLAVANDPTLQRIVESKVADIEQLKYNKDMAIKGAKDNISGYLTEREKVWKEASTQHAVIAKQELEKMIPSFDWLKEKTPAADGSDKAVVDDHNKFVQEVRQQIGAVLSDNTPQMRAILIAGTVQLFNLQRVHDDTVKERDALKTQLDDVTSKYNKVKDSSKNRLAESAAPSAGTAPAAPKVEDQVNLRAGDALDALARKISEQRTAAGS
jgi:hypothetical protein